MGPFQVEIGFYDFDHPEVSNSLNFWEQLKGDSAETTCHFDLMETESFICVNTLQVAFVGKCIVCQLPIAIHTFKKF